MPMCKVCGATDCSYETHQREHYYIDIVRPKLIEKALSWPDIKTTTRKDVDKVVRVALRGRRNGKAVPCR